MRFNDLPGIHGAMAKIGAEPTASHVTRDGHIAAKAFGGAVRSQGARASREGMATASIAKERWHFNRALAGA